jgi:hypothetical protein
MSDTYFVGYPQYTRTITITETAGLDVSQDAVQFGLGTYTDPPATWADPSVVIVDRPTDSTITVKMLIDGVPAGTYWPWWCVDDNPETVPQLVPVRIVVVDPAA